MRSCDVKVTQTQDSRGGHSSSACSARAWALAPSLHRQTHRCRCSRCYSQSHPAHAVGWPSVRQCAILRTHRPAQDHWTTGRASRHTTIDQTISKPPNGPAIVSSFPHSSTPPLPDAFFLLAESTCLLNVEASSLSLRKSAHGQHGPRPRPAPPRSRLPVPVRRPPAPYTAHSRSGGLSLLGSGRRWLRPAIPARTHRDADGRLVTHTALRTVC